MLFFINCYAQIPEIVQHECYGSSESDESYCVINDEDGYLLAIHLGENAPGVTNYHGSGDIWIVKTDSMGSIIWERCYGGSSGDVPQKIVKIESDYLIYGYTFSTDGDVQSGNNGYSDLWVIRINEIGNIIWEKTYGCTGYDEPRDIILTPDGGFIMIDRIGIGGGDVSQYYGNGDVWMCKCDSLGNIEWEKTLGNQGVDNCGSMIINSENNIVMIGTVQQHGGMVDCYPHAGGGDVWVVILDLDGNIISQYCYGGSHYEFGYNIKETDYGYVFTASSFSYDGDVSGHHGYGEDNWYDIWIVKINHQGNILWQNSFGGLNGESPRFINETNDKGLFFIGTTWSNDGDVSGNHSSGGYDTDIWVVKLDSLGEIEWQQCFGGAGSERLENTHTILKKNDYNYVIISSSDYSPSYDVQCGTINGLERDVWFFELKDCTYYAPATPDTPCGADTACSASGAGTVYTVAPAQNAWRYAWQLLPTTAGTISGDSTTATVNWAENYEGTAVITVRSQNDCGQSEWSEPKYTQVQTCLGTEETPAENTVLRVYPNPAKDYVIFEFDVKEETEIKIYDAFGREVLCLPVSRKKTVWVTKNMRSGLYYYKTEIKGVMLSGKVVISE
jgi:hypothetical protein